MGLCPKPREEMISSTSHWVLFCCYKRFGSLVRFGFACAIWAWGSKCFAFFAGFFGGVFKKASRSPQVFSQIDCAEVTDVV